MNVQRSVFAPRDWLARHGRAIVPIILGDAPADGRVDARVRSLNAGRTSLTLGGASGQVLLRLYDPAMSGALDSFNRERKMLRALNGTGLAPEFVASSKAASFVATEWVEGERLSPFPSEDDLLEVAHAMGRWCAAVSAQVPRRDVEGDWHAYLSRYDAFSESIELAEQRQALSSIPLGSQTVAVKRLRLNDFAKAPDGRLVGFEFSEATWKPLGWDLMVAARSIIRRSPGRFEEIVTELVRGWCSVSSSIAPPDLVRLAKVFALRTAFSRPTVNPRPLEAALNRFNETSKDRAVQAFAVPFMTDRLVARSPAEIGDLRAHLEQQASIATPGNAMVADDPETASDPSAVGLLASLCALCKGKCCESGLQRHAFLNAVLLGQGLTDGSEADRQAVVDRYLSYLPDRHVAGSCLFHGATGCTIPRQERSPTCNQFTCHEASRIVTETNEKSRARPTLLLAKSGGVPSRAEFRHGDRREAVDPAVLGSPQPNP